MEPLKILNVIFYQFLGDLNQPKSAIGYLLKFHLLANVATP